MPNPLSIHAIKVVIKVVFQSKKSKILKIIIAGIIRAFIRFVKLSFQYIVAFLLDNSVLRMMQILQSPLIIKRKSIKWCISSFNTLNRFLH
jgi:hypothetical protein